MESVLKDVAIDPDVDIAVQPQPVVQDRSADDDLANVSVGLGVVYAGNGPVQHDRATLRRLALRCVDMDLIGQVSSCMSSR